MAVNQIIQFDLPADQPAKLIDFYSGLFGWSFERVTQAPVEFYVAMGEDGPDIAVSVLKKQNPGHPPTNYVQVASIDEAVEKALSLGATLALPKMKVGGGRAIANLIDPAGNIIGLLQEGAD